MKILPVQFNKQSGPDATSQFKLEFTIDESQSTRFYDFCKSVKKGTELLLLAFDVEKDEEEVKEFITETPEDAKTRLNKRMHVLIGDIAEEKNMKSEEVKKILKKFLIEKHYIKTSTSELDLKGFAAAIFYLSTEIKEQENEAEIEE